jgi:hypothetical protein
MDNKFAEAHRHFSADCFNRAWELIEKESRTQQETTTMILRAMASLWHWTQREDCSAQNMSIGYWQVSRVLALAGEGGLATRFGTLCLEVSATVAPFYRGYAYECLGRAAVVSGAMEDAARYLAEARRCVAEIQDPQDRRQLEADLDTLS